MSGLAELSQRLEDPIWRLCNLYAVKEADTGRVVPFVPRPEQLAVFRAVYVEGRKRIIILKARRLGMSTAIDVMAMDAVCFNSGFQVSIIDQTQDDASKKLNAICKVAFASERFRALAENLTVSRNNDSAWEVRGAGDDTPSSIYAGKNARGGTNQLLHISEWGPIQADDPRRSEEILTGALPSAEHGVVIIETTWKGGRGGHLWGLVKRAMEGTEEASRAWKLFFFPWFNDPSYSEPGAGAIEPDVTKYLSEKETALGISFTQGQRNWYARSRRELGMFVWREFPTVIEECFRAPIEGAIYADLLDGLRARGRIQPSEVDRSALVHTFWDLGSPVNTVTWYVQLVGTEIRIIDIDQNLDLTAVDRVAHIRAKGYPLGSHYLPHDAASTPTSGRTVQQEFELAGLTSVRVIPRCVDVWIGINRLRQIMPRMTFRLPACERGIDALANYHTRRETSSGLVQDQPVHDWSSHASDALRMFAEAEAAGMLEGGSATARGSRRGPGPRVLTGVRHTERADPFDDYTRAPRVMR